MDKSAYNYLTRKRIFGFWAFFTIIIFFGWIYSNNQLNLLNVTPTFLKTSKIMVLLNNFRSVYPNPKDGTSQTDEIQYKLWEPDSPVSIANITAGAQNFTVRYERCLHIPPPPRDFPWAEEAFIYDPPPKTLIDVVDRMKSRVIIVGPTVVKLGEKIKLKIELKDGYGRKRTGRDLVRVWMKETSLGAGSVAKVTDNMDGSYDAEFVAFWVGRPTIRVAVIAPREFLKIQFKRRYICPAVLLFVGVFGRNERTQCSYYPQIPGYTEVCNLTTENFGRPWYCGQPRSKGMGCNRWESMSNQHVLQHEKMLNTPIERDLLSSNFQTMIVPTNISVEIKSDGDNKIWTPPNVKCNVPDRSHTWIPHPPAGFLYKKQWTSKSCRGRDRSQGIKPCVKNFKILIIGDSTVRQIFSSLTSMVPCLWGTKRITITHKHEQFKCSNQALNATFEYNSHELPFRTSLAAHKYFKSITSHLKAHHKFDGKHSQVIILIHLYSHFINYHTHVFYESLIRMKPAIITLLDANPNASVIIKGPHSYAFQFDLEKYIRKPEGYLEIYEEYIKTVFGDVKDRVIYLDVADITTATEQKNIHPEDYVVNEMVYKIFDYVCKY